MPYFKTIFLAKSSTLDEAPNGMLIFNSLFIKSLYFSFDKTKYACVILSFISSYIS